MIISPRCLTLLPTVSFCIPLFADFDSFEENIERLFQHFLRGAGGLGTEDDGVDSAQKQLRRQQGIDLAKDAFADAFIDQRADQILVGISFLLDLFLAVEFQSL